MKPLPYRSTPLARVLILAPAFLAGLAAAAGGGTVSWIVDGDGLWQEGSNWSTGLPPGPDDSVVINRAGGPYTITVSDGDQAALSVACAENLVLAGGSLTVAGAITVAGSFSQTGGALVGAILLSPLSCSGSACDMDGVTVRSDLLVGVGANTLVEVTGGMVVDGTVHLGQGEHYGRLVFQGAQTLSGAGEVVFSDNGSNALQGLGGDLVLGPGVTVRGVRGGILGQYAFVVQGEVSSDAAGGVITLDGVNWRNEGRIEAAAGGSLVLDGVVRTADLGVIEGSGGEVVINGVIENTGEVLALTAATGSWILDQGAIRGGAVAPGSGGSRIVFRGTGGKLDGVVMQADMFVGETANTYVAVENGLTLDGVARLGSASTYGRLNFAGAQSLDGEGEVLFSENGSNTLYAQNGTLTIEPGVLIHGSHGRILAPQGFVLRDTVRCDVAGGVIVLDGENWRNEGLLEAVAGGALSLDGTVTTADLGAVRGSEGRVEIDGVLDNTGAALVLDDATGSWILDSGTVVGGSVASGAEGFRLLYRGTAGKLDGVTMDCDMIIGEDASTYLTILDGLTINGTAYLGWSGNYGRLTVSGDQTLGGSGHLVFGSSGVNNVIGYGGTLTIGPGLTVRGEHGRFLGTLSYLNQGIIQADVPGGELILEGTGWTNQGRLLADGAALTVNSPLTNSDRVTVGRGGILDTDEAYTQTGGVTEVDSTGVLHSDLTLDLQAGLLSGYGTTEGSLASGGVVAPGASAGVLTHAGDFAQAASGTLMVELGGTQHGLHDRLAISGAASLDGTLQVDWIYDFWPAAGDSFVVMEFASRTGMFADISLPDMPAGLALAVEYRDDSVLLRAVGSEAHATIGAVEDEPDDQGGFVRITWYASTLDDPGLPEPVTSYAVQKFAATWQMVGTVPAAGLPSYTATVPTDDILVVGQDEPWSYYRILASTDTPGVFYASPADSGYSVDNLPPPPPVLAMLEAAESRILSWTNPDVPDLAHTCLYRIDALGVLPDSLMICTSDTSWAETHRFYYDYYCVAEDIHGNVGEAGNVVVHAYPTSAGGSPPPVPTLAQNHPNPFNPSTRIAFLIPDRQVVTLRVFDLSGRLVRKLIDAEPLAAGRHEAAWNGRDEAGRPAASGTYFYRLQAGGISQTRRMVLVK